MAADSDAFLTVVNSTGTAFTSSSYLGGNGQDFGYRVTLDPTGNIYLSGEPSPQTSP